MLTIPVPEFVGRAYARLKGGRPVRISEYRLSGWRVGESITYGLFGGEHHEPSFIYKEATCDLRLPTKEVVSESVNAQGFTMDKKVMIEELNRHILKHY